MRAIGETLALGGVVRPGATTRGIVTGRPRPQPAGFVSEANRARPQGRANQTA